MNRKAISQKYCLQTVSQNAYGVNVNTVTTGREPTSSKTEGSLISGYSLSVCHPWCATAMHNPITITLCTVI